MKKAENNMTTTDFFDWGGDKTRKQIGIRRTGKRKTEKATRFE